MGRGERGMTFVGMLCVLAMVGVIGYAGVRLTPVYLNYLKVTRSMEAAATDFKSDNPDLAGMRRSLEKHWQIEDIDAVDSKDVEFNKDESGQVSMHVAYDHAVPYIANVFLSVHFDTTVKVQ
jgi:Tfp pilus assembly protein PilE